MALFKMVLISLAMTGFFTWSVAQQKVALNMGLIRQDTAVLIGKLANGLTYYIRPNAKPEKKVELRFVVRAGSLQEDEDQRGLAHFMEHMEFNGLKHFPKNEMVDYLQKIGVRFGADINASTGWDRTAYELPVPTDDPTNLPNAFQIVRDWADGALLTTDDINGERKVILEELRMRMRNADFRLLNKVLPDLMNGSRYASRLSGGKEDIVANGDPSLIRRFYADWYRPDLMAVIVVGDITVPEAKGLITKYFASLKKPLHGRVRRFYGVEPYVGKKAMVLSDPEEVNYSFSLIYRAQPDLQPKTVKEFRESLVEAIAMQCLNRRLRNRGQSADPPFMSASLSEGGNIAGLTLGQKAMQLDVRPVDNFDTAIHAAVKEIVSAAAFGFTNAEVKTSVNAVLSSYENGFNQRANILSASLGEGYVDAFTKGDMPIGIVHQYEYVKELLPGISMSEINARVAKWREAPSRYFTLITGPTSGMIRLPGDQKLLNMVDGSFRQVPSRERGLTADTTLLSAMPVPGKIVSETEDKELGAMTFTLSNGVLVTVKQTDFQKDQVLFGGMKKGGSNNYGKEDRYNLLFLDNLTAVMGVGNFTPAALSDVLSDKPVAVSVGMSSIANTVEGSSDSANVETMLQLAYLKFTQPRKDLDLYKGWLTKVSNYVPQLRADPANVYRDTLTKVLYGGDPLAPVVIPSLGGLNDINVDRTIEMYKNAFGNADGFHFFLVGNLSLEKIRPLIEKYLGGFPSKGTSPGFRDNGVRLVTGNHFFQFFRGQDNKASLLDMYHGETTYAPDQSLNATILAEAMTIEIIDTIREKMQLIYSGGASASVTKEPFGYFNFGIQMPCGPENVNAIFHELDNEVQRYRTTGVSAMNLEKVKKEMCERFRESLKENATWLSELQAALFWGRDKNDFLHFQEKVNSVSIQSLKETANLIFSRSNFRAVAYPDRDSTK